MMKKRLFLILMAAAMTGTLLMGCGNDAAPSEENEANTEAGSDKVKIRFLSAMELVDEEMIDTFEEANPDIEVEFDYVDSGNYSAKFAALASSHEVPDVFWTQSGYYCDQISEGLLMDISDELAEEAYEEIWHGRILIFRPFWRACRTSRILDAGKWILMIMGFPLQ